MTSLTSRNAARALASHVRTVHGYRVAENERLAEIMRLHNTEHAHGYADTRTPNHSVNDTSARCSCMASDPGAPMHTSDQHDDANRAILG